MKGERPRSAMSGPRSFPLVVPARCGRSFPPVSEASAAFRVGAQRFCTFCVSLVVKRPIRDAGTTRYGARSFDATQSSTEPHPGGMNEPPAPSFSEDAFPLQAVTGTVIAASFTVFKTFGCGFVEPVYRRAMMVELRHRGVWVEQEVKYELFHRGESVGYYKADMVVDSRVIVEIKTGPLPDPLDSDKQRHHPHGRRAHRCGEISQRREGFRWRRGCGARRQDRHPRHHQHRWTRQLARRPPHLRRRPRLHQPRRRTDVGFRKSLPLR